MLQSVITAQSGKVKGKCRFKEQVSAGGDLMADCVQLLEIDPCFVQLCTGDSAAGTVFQISGNRQISIIKNGSFYNTDAGIEPAFFLDKPESFYDRPAFVEYLHELK